MGGPMKLESMDGRTKMDWGGRSYQSITKSTIELQYSMNFNGGCCQSQWGESFQPFTFSSKVWNTLNTKIFSQSYIFGLCEMEIFNFLWLICDNLLPTKSSHKEQQTPLDPPCHPKGVPPIQDQYKQNTPAPIAILIKFTYMLTNNIENYMLNFWNLPRRLRPKIWPKEGQKFS